MRVSLRWLRQYVPLDMPLAQIVETLTMLGLEVESVVDLGWDSKRLVICEILDVRPHPDAEKLVLCTVMADEAKPLEVVCGAKNMKAGDRVVLAKVGAKLPPSSAHPEGIEMKPARIRGIVSNGMLCSGIEMGYNDDTSGIMILAPNAPVAEPFDALLEIKVTPNRPDCLSVIGVARELAAATRKKLTVPAPVLNEIEERADSAVRIQVPAREQCPRYTARVVRGVKIGPSPLWLQRAVESAGLRAINNVVDVTNYVMLEMNQPLHAFDLEKISQRRIIVRLAEQDEPMQTLDGQEMKLAASDLVIADAKGPVALAGVMGGLQSEISPETSTVLIESAYFNPPTIRRTSKRLDKSTDSSYRFERGTDPRRLLLALDRAAELIQQTAGGEILKGAIDVLGPIPEPKPVWISVERLNQQLDMRLSGRDIADTLIALGFEILRTDPERLQVGIPSHRVDISLEADLVEEVARLIGYGKIPPSLPSTVANAHLPAPLAALRDQLAECMVGAGYNQTINYSFIAEEDLQRLELPADRLIRLRNPLSKDQSVMRTSLLPGILANVVRNQNFGVLDIRLFEIGRIYLAPNAPGAADAKAAAESPAPSEAQAPARAGLEAEGVTSVVAPAGLPPAAQEDTYLMAALSGGGKTAWNEPPQEADFFDIKGVAEMLLSALGLEKAQIETIRDVSWLHPGRAAALVLDGRRVCWFGEVHPEIARRLDLRRRLYLLEMPLDPLTAGQAARSEVRFRELAKFPAMERDLALVVGRDAAALDIERVMRAQARDLLESIRLFDLYEGANIPPDKKSLAYSLVFRRADRTLTEDEVNAALERILKALADRFGAALRSA